MTKPQTRHGTIYILVLVTSMIVTMIGLLGFKMIQAQAAVARADTQRDEAVVLAESAVQWGVHYVMLKADWREPLTSGVTFRTMDLGQGQIAITITDPDGDLSDGDTDSFTIRGTGRIGDAVQTYEVQMSSGAGDPHPSLNESLTVGGILYVDSGIMTLESGGTALGQRQADGSNTASLLITPTDPVEIPDQSLITTWSGMGTAITPAMHGGQIRFTALSTTSAPFGLTPDPNGVYIVDAGRANLSVSAAVVVGTIVVTNLGGSTVTFTNSRLRFGPNGGPTLIVDGNLRFESNFLSEIQQGILYVNGDIDIVNNMVLIGKIMATGNVTVDEDVEYATLNEHPSAVLGPPVGFTVPSGGYEVVPGSWQRIVN